jgi:elongation factor Ts
MEDIKKLRDLTGAGIVDCKKALDETGGDLDKAVDLLRKKGGAKAAKKADRATNEGLVDIAQDGNKKISIVKISCETDFVARTDDFLNFVKEVAEAGLTGSSEEFFNNIKDEMVLKVGENLTFGGGETLEGEYVVAYKHSNNRVATAVAFSKDVDASLGNDIAMQAAAMSPSYLNPEDVPSGEIEREKDIYREQLKAEGKPEEMIEKILMGKINKYYEEICLIKQTSIKEDKKSVEQVLKEVDPELKIVKFARYSL